MEHKLIKMKASYIEEGKPANQAKLLVEQDDLYLEVLEKSETFIKRCDATITMAKKYATLSKERFNYG